MKQQNHPAPVRIINPMAAFINGMKQQQNIDPAFLRVLNADPQPKHNKKKDRNK